MAPIVYFVKKMHAYAGGVLYLNALGMMAVGLLNGLGIVLLIPLLQISGLAEGAIGAASSSFSWLKGLQELPMSVGLLLVLSLFACFTIVQSLIQRNLSLRDVRFHTGFVNVIRLETYRLLLESSWEFYSRRRKSDLITSLTDELGRVSGGTHNVLQLLASVIFTAIQIVIAFWLSVEMTLFVLACGLGIAFFSRAFIRKSARLGSQSSELARSYMGGISDDLNGMKDIKSNMLEGARYRWLEEWCGQMALERHHLARMGQNSQLVYKTCSALLLSVFLYVSVLLFHTRMEELLVILVLFSRLWPRFIGIQSNLEQLAAAWPAFRSLAELQEASRAAREIQDSPGPGRDVQPMRLETGIECRNVSYRYDRNEPHYSLREVSLLVPAKRMTAIVGRSGAGKSTLVDILIGNLLPEEGEVRIDGVPLTSRNLLELRRSISYVPQDPLLFNGTIRDNLRMVEPRATEERIWDALRFAAAAPFVEKLPRGLDTYLGDRGVRLSGGERQRLVLARAILRNPSILVLDEATSALDTENEEAIRQALDRLNGRLTLIVIAHRMSTIRNADRVLVLEQGRLVQQGAYAELLQDKGGIFSTLDAKQRTDIGTAVNT